MNSVNTRFLRISLFGLILGVLNFSCMAVQPKAQAQVVKEPVAQTPQLLDVSAQLIDEVAKGDSCSLEKVKELIKAGADVNAENRDGYTPLMLACDSPIIIKYLIANKANVNAQNKEGVTVLMHACFSVGMCTTGYRVLSLFFDTSKFLKFNQVRNDYFEVIQILLAAGADINLKDNNGDSIVEVAKKYELEEITKVLQGSRRGRLCGLTNRAKAKLGFNKKK